MRDYIDGGVGEPRAGAGSELVAELGKMEHWPVGVIRGGNHYAMILVELNPKPVLWVRYGCSRDDVRPLADEPGTQGCRWIEDDAMEWNCSNDWRIAAGTGLASASRMVSFSRMAGR